MRTPCWLLAPALALGLAALAPAADPPKADAEQIAKLVKQLGDDDFDTREKATKDLEKIGNPALEALRKAAQDSDSEIKTRAKKILEKVEKKAAAEKALAPTKVKLSFKDTPLEEAIAEFNKKSGYTIQVHDPDNKLKDRKVTLDTGEVTFWEAFDKFCEKAGLVEATWSDIMKPIAVPVPGGPGGGILPPPPPIAVPKDFKADPPPAPKEDPAPKKDEDKKPAPAAARARQAPAPPAGGGGIARPAGRVAPGIGLLGGNAIVVVDGKPKTVPTCYSGAIRIRALKEAPNAGFPFPVVPAGGAPAAKDDTHTVWLEVRAEPKVQLQMIQSVAVEKATDDLDQKLDKVTPPAAAAPGGLPGLPAPAVRPLAPIGGFGMAGLGGTQSYPVQLKKGEKEAKALKEFAGSISAMVMAPPEPVITADKITKAAGETFKGKDGGHIKVTEVKEEDGKITIKFEMEQPPFAGGGIGIGLPGAVPLPAPVPLPPLPALPPPAIKPAAGGAGLAVKAGAAPAQVVQIQIGGPGVPAVPPGGGVAVGRAFVSAPGITLVDDKGKTIAQTGGAPPKIEFAPGGAPKLEYTQEYKLEKDQKPAKLVYSASQMVTVEIPFSFKDVPLK
jgi:hypothetical protein